MKILISLSYYLPNISGLTIYTKNLAEELAGRGYTTTILTSQHKKPLSLSQSIHGVNVIRVPYLFKLSKGFFMPRFLWYAFVSVRSSDVIIVTLPQFEGFIVAFLAKLMGKRLYCMYLCELRLSNNAFHLFIELFLNISNYISMLLADKVTTMTQDFAKHSKLLPHFKEKLISIYPLVPVPVINKHLQKKLQDSIPNSKKYYIGIVSRISAEKGIEYLLETIPLIKKGLNEEFLILFAGPKNPVGEEEYWKKISPLLKKYNDHLFFFGALTEGQMGAFYALLNVLVLPSINSTEAFGMVQVEAMLCGVPVVASNLPGVRVPIQKTGMGELAKPKDPRDLADKIVRILLNKEKYIKERVSIESQFSFTNTIAQYERLLSL